MRLVVISDTHGLHNSILTAEPGYTHSLCHIDPFDVLVMHPSAVALWTSVSRSINIDAPTIEMRMIQADWYQGEGIHNGWIISGVCIQSECD